MLQVAVKAGRPLVVEVADPAAIPGFVLIEVRASCISPGTELAAMGKPPASLVSRVLANPGKVIAAVRDVPTKGVGSLWARARGGPAPREQPTGYSAAGIVLDVGSGVEGLQRGMSVAVAGAGHANHAQLAVVPANLVVPVPAGVDLEDASTVALGAIALQAVRRAASAIGEQVAVIGCGALGMLAIQILRASGCRVIAMDLDPRRLAMAEEYGAEVTADAADPECVRRAIDWSGGHGVDACIIFAATSSAEPLSQAFRMSRRRGRVVLAGVVGSEFRREDMYAKELDFVISTSYGPGRYDDDYELRGHDYPFAYVRWTENRNMAAYLELVRSAMIKVKPLIGAREPIERAEDAYRALTAADRPFLAVLTSGGLAPRPVAADISNASKPREGVVSVALVGPGSFVAGVLVPILQSFGDDVRIPWSWSRSGLRSLASAAGIPGCRPAADFQQILADPAVNAVLIGTRHDSHATLAIAALEAGKSVFVEKPPCLTLDELERLRTTLDRTDATYMVGYNRRYSPLVARIKTMTANRIHPLMIQYSMNAGYLPKEHWTQGPEGGGRLVGEACHIVDLFRSLIGVPAVSASVMPLRSRSTAAFPNDNFVLTLAYGDGSVASLVYFALGHPSVSKERMEVVSEGRIIVLDDYRSLSVHGARPASNEWHTPDKGHAEELRVFCEAVRTGVRFPIPWDEIEESSRVTIEADRICRTGEAV